MKITPCELDSCGRYWELDDEKRLQMESPPSNDLLICLQCSSFKRGLPWYVPEPKVPVNPWNAWIELLELSKDSLRYLPKSGSLRERLEVILDRLSQKEATDVREISTE